MKYQFIAAHQQEYALQPIRARRCGRDVREVPGRRMFLTILKSPHTMTGQCHTWRTRIECSAGV